MQVLQKIKKKFNDSEFFKSLIEYTIIYFILTFLMVTIFNIYGKNGITIGDGIRNHMLHLTYFRELLVNFVRTGNLSFFTWNIGAGFDLFSNYAYLIFGDVFSYLSILVRTKDIIFLYNLLIALRFYFVGFSFLLFARYKNLKCLPSVIGALMYTFSSNVIYFSFFQPYYIIPIIIFPFVLIGIEKIITENKTIFYTIMIALLFLTNFYFAYSLSIIIAIYGVTLTIINYKNGGGLQKGTSSINQSIIL